MYNLLDIFEVKAEISNIKEESEGALVEYRFV